MIVRLPLLGSGTQADPFRVSLPTYFLHDPIDVIGKVAVAELPDTDHPFPPAAIALLPTAATAVGPAVMGMTAAQIAQWNAHLDGRYKEHAGAFRPVPQ